MISVTASLLVALSLYTPCLAPNEPGRADDLRSIYESGQEFAAFLREADSRTALWHGNYENGEVSKATADRARNVPGRWRILAVAVDGCSDSVSTIPFLAHLTEAVGSLEMRIVDSTAGRALMEARPTPDGRAATPTLIILNEDFEEVGCWIERPTPLQEWALGEATSLDRGEFFRQKMSWYAEDRGQTTVAEIVDILEAASRGERICGG